MKQEFFTTSGGLSETSANHLSNLGQEKVKSLRTFLSDIRLYDTYLQLPGSGTESLASKGVTQADSKAWTEYLDKVGQVDSFTAWVREAAKEKKAAIKAIRDLSFKEWSEEHRPGAEIRVPGLTEWVTREGRTTPVPEDPPVLEESIEVLAKQYLGVEEYQEYLSLNSRAAVYGNFVHSDKAELVVARRELSKVLRSPIMTEGTGRDLLIRRGQPSLPVEDLEKPFESLQSEYRRLEASLNRIKFKLREKALADYRSAMDRRLEGLRELEALNDEYRNYAASLRESINRGESEMEAWKNSEVSRISKLKIRIPEALQGIYEWLEGLGKEEGLVD